VNAIIVQVRDLPFGCVDVLGWSLWVVWGVAVGNLSVNLTLFFVVSVVLLYSWFFGWLWVF
jgi:hypothetical protein